MVVVGQGRDRERESARDALLVGSAEEAAELGNIVQTDGRRGGRRRHDREVEHPKPGRAVSGHDEIGPLAEQQVAELGGPARWKRDADLPEIEYDEGLRPRAVGNERSHPRLPPWGRAVHVDG
jgi:hypothetical protein